MAHLHDSVPEVARADKTGVVLTVSGLAETKGRLRSILEAKNFQVLEAGGFREAIRALKKRQVFAVLCDRDLPDGTSFRDFLADAQRRQPEPLVIVTCRNADEQLWGEVLNLGGYDVLAQPLEDAEVGRTVRMAWLHWKSGTARMRAATAEVSTGDAWTIHTASA